MSRRLVFLLSLVACLVATACGDQNTTNQVVNTGIDCGLVRSDLTGTWAVQYASTPSSTVSNCVCEQAGCDPANYNGATIDVAFNFATYSPVSVFGSEQSSSFQVIGDRSDGGADAGVAGELAGSVEADSCLGLFRIWEKDDMAFLTCLGTFRTDTRTLEGSCDSVEFDRDLDGTIDATCDIDTLIDVAAGP
jgi:hypothetical protein